MVETATFKGTQRSSTACGKHECFEISFLWHRLNLALQMVPQKFLQSLVLTEVIQMSMFTSLPATCVATAWASLWDFVTVAGMDGVFWPCEQAAELGLEEQGAALLHGHCWRSASRSAWKGSLPGLRKQAVCFTEGYLASRLLRFFISS